MINYRRGNVSILDREALEDASCECYRNVKIEIPSLVQETYRRLMLSSLTSSLSSSSSLCDFLCKASLTGNSKIFQTKNIHLSVQFSNNAGKGLDRLVCL